jgi:hypothetical protein
LFVNTEKSSLSISGVKQNGSVSHFFHRTFKAYNTGTRKRRKINTVDADVRWHKTGKTKPVLLDGKQLGSKKIMVLYMSPAKGGKAEKTNWVMHQYHLGIGEDERDGEYVVSKLFFQQQFKPGDKNAQELTTSDDLESIAAEADLTDFTTLPADKHVGTIQVVHNSEHNLNQVTTSDDLESMAAEADLPDFTTLPADKHVGTIQEVQNPEHNLYQVTEYSCAHYLYFLCSTHLYEIGKLNLKIEHIPLTCFLIIENAIYKI